MGQKRIHFLSSRCYMSSFVGQAANILDRVEESDKMLMKEANIWNIFLSQRLAQNVPLLYAMLNWYDLEKDVFVIGSRELVFSPNDVALILGVPNHGEEVILSSKPTGALSKHQLKDKMVEMEKGASPVEIRFLVLHLLCHMFFPSSAEKMPKFFDEVSSSLEKFKRYNWPNAIHAFLMGSFRAMAEKLPPVEGELHHRPDSSLGYIYGCTHVLIIWFLEHTTSFIPQNPSLRPRLLRWSDKVSFTLKELGATVPEMTEEQVLEVFENITSEEKMLLSLSEDTQDKTPPHTPSKRKTIKPDSRVQKKTKIATPQPTPSSPEQRPSSPTPFSSPPPSPHPPPPPSSSHNLPSLPPPSPSHTLPSLPPPSPSHPPQPTASSSTPPIEFWMELERKIIGKFDLLDSKLDTLNNRIDLLDQKIDKKINHVELRVNRLHSDVVTFSQSVGSAFDELNSNIDELLHRSPPDGSPPPTPPHPAAQHTSPIPPKIETIKPAAAEKVEDGPYPVKYPGKDRITEEEREIIHRRLSIIPSRNDLVFKKGKILAFRDSMDGLLQDKYLEDCHIEAYAKILALRREKDETAYRQYIYISPTLTLHYPQSKTGKSKMVDYCIKQVTTENINTIPIIMFPVCSSQHWFLLLGIVKDKKWIIHDSLRNPKRKEVVRKVIKMLHEACKNKVNTDFSKWTITSSSSVPQQENAVDCGVYVIKYMEHIANIGAQDWKGCKDWQKNMPMYRAQICAEILKYFVDN